MLAGIPTQTGLAGGARSYGSQHPFSAAVSAGAASRKARWERWAKALADFKATELDISNPVATNNALTDPDDTVESPDPSPSTTQTNIDTNIEAGLTSGFAGSVDDFFSSSGVLGDTFGSENGSGLNIKFGSLVIIGLIAAILFLVLSKTKK
jgi:hypothetical protein